MKIIKFEPKYRDNLIFMILEAKTDSLCLMNKILDNIKLM